MASDVSVLTEPEDRANRRFGTVRRYARGGPLFAAGEPGQGMLWCLKGVMALSQRDGLGPSGSIGGHGQESFRRGGFTFRTVTRWWKRMPRRMSRPLWCRLRNCAP